MSYQILPTLILFFAIFGAILMVLRRLPQATEGRAELEKTVRVAAAGDKLKNMGLEAQDASRLKHYGQFWVKKIWRFVLEAKEMAPTGASVLKIKRLFAARPKVQNFSLSEETGREEVEGKTEQDFLEAIKREPKDYAHYDGLGKLYLANASYADARDIYLYLTSHSSGTGDFWARLGFAAFKLKDFKQAAQAYKKSVALDSSQPNRYYNLAQSYKALGELENAKEALGKALEIDPQNFKFLEFKSRLKNP